MMQKRILFLAAVLCGVLVFAPWPVAAQEAAQNKTVLTAAGSGVNLGITRVLANAFMAKQTGVDIKVPGSIGTKGAITAIKDGAIAFGLISRPLKDTEKTDDYTTLAYAKTALVIAANETVRDEAITSAELVSIYGGEKTKWKDGSEIVVQIREESDSGFMMLENAIPAFKKVCEESRNAKRWSVYFTDQEANNALAHTPNAIGVTDIGMIATEKLTVKPLELDGVKPSVETLAAGQYPLVRTLYILYRKKDLPPEGQAFLDFLKSEEAAALMRANGYVPMAGH